MGDGVLMSKGINGGRPPEAREKIRRALLGHFVSAETRAKISATKRGKKFTAEHRESLRNAQNRPDVAERKRRAMSGARNPHWLGDAVGGSAVRARARRLFREEHSCERCVAGVPSGGGRITRHHEDGNPRNNALKNIRWFCQAHHALLHRERGVNHLPLARCGETNPSAKLTNEKAQDIRHLYATRRYSYQSLATKFKVSKAVVGGVVRSGTYGGEPVVSRRTRSWSVGLTKETDFRVARQAYSLRRTLARKRRFESVI